MKREERMPQLMLERLSRGEAEVDSVYADRLEALSSEELEVRLQELRDDDARTLAAHTPEDMVARIEARRASGAPRRARRAVSRRGGWFAGLAVAAAVAAAVAYGPSVRVEEVASASSPDEVVRIKGARPEVSIWLKVGGEATRLERGDEVAERDVVQVRYRSGGRRHGVIVSLDGRGVVTIHHPSEPGGSTALDRGGDVTLGYGYELDDAPEYERFFMIAADEELDARSVSEALETEGVDGARRGWEVSGHDVDEFTLRKVVR